MGVSIGDFVKLVKGTFGINVSALRFIREVLRGDLDRGDIAKFTKDVGTLMDVVDEASEELQLIIAVSTAFAISDIIAMARAGPLADIMTTKVAVGVANFVGPIANVYKRLKEEEKRIKGLLYNETVQESLATIRTVHRIALVVSNEYREEYARLQESIRNVSLSVFGEVSTINSALALLQMGIHDITALRGEPVDVGNNRYIDASITLTNRIESQSARYAQYPGQFWLDFQNQFMGPINESKTLINREKDGRVDRALDFLDTLSAGVETVGDRMDEYIEEADTLMPADDARALRDWRRNWERDYGRPLIEINTILGEEIPELSARAEALDIKQQEEDDMVGEILEIVNDPFVNDEAARSRQTARIDSILNNVLSVGEAEDRRIREATERINSLYEGLPE